MFSKAIGVDVAHVYRVLVKDSNPGLKFFICDYKKILYCDGTKELMVINWIKYNVPTSINTIKCIQKEILKVKNKEFVKMLFNKCIANGLDVDKIFENFKFEVNSEEKKRNQGDK